MKTTSLFTASILVVAGCASAPKPAAETASTTHTTAAAPEKQESEQSALAQWAESTVKKEEASAPKTSNTAMDPLAMADDTENGLLPKIENTPKKELRATSRAALQAGFGIVKSAATTEEAVKKLTASLGKPTWIENGKKRIWVAKEGAGKCHRLVFDTDGSVEIDSAPATEERQLTATARQNFCTGEIKRGVSK